MKSRLLRLGAPVFGALLLVGTSASLAEPSKPMSISEAPWQFSFDIYGWLPDAPATIKVAGVEIANIPETFDNILKALEMMAMLRFDARKGPLGLFVSPFYYEGDYNKRFTGLLGESRKLELRENALLVDYGASYEIGRWDIGAEPGSGTVTLAPYAGFRFFHDPISIDVNPGFFDIGVRVRKTITFNTPIVGLQSSWQLTPRVKLKLHGDYGGFGISNVKNTYQAVGTLAYHFKRGKLASKVYAGYRYLHIEYDDQLLDIQVAVRGPLVGIGFDF